MCTALNVSHARHHCCALGLMHQCWCPPYLIWKRPTPLIDINQQPLEVSLLVLAPVLCKGGASANDAWFSISGVISFPVLALTHSLACFQRNGGIMPPLPLSKQKAPSVPSHDPTISDFSPVRTKASLYVISYLPFRKMCRLVSISHSHSLSLHPLCVSGSIPPVSIIAIPSSNTTRVFRSNTIVSSRKGTEQQRPRSN